MKRFFSKNTQQRITAFLFVLGLITYVSAYVVFLNSSPRNSEPDHASLSAITDRINNAPGSVESVQGVADAVGSPEAAGLTVEQGDPAEVKGESTARVLAQGTSGTVDLQIRKMVKSSLGYTVTVCNAGTGTQSIPWLQQGNTLVQQGYTVKLLNSAGTAVGSSGLMSQTPSPNGCTDYVLLCNTTACSSTTTGRVVVDTERLITETNENNNSIDVTVGSSATVLANCPAVVSTWRIDSVTPTYANGKVGLSIKGSFPDIENCGRQKMGTAGFSMVYVFKGTYGVEEKSYYAYNKNEITSFNSSEIVMAPIYTYSNGTNWSVSLFYCSQPASAGACSSGSSSISRVTTVQNPLTCPVNDPAIPIASGLAIKEGTQNGSSGGWPLYEVTAGNASVVWNANASFPYYYVRIDDLSDGEACSGKRDHCPPVPQTQTANSFSYTFEEGKTYKIWVNNANKCGSWGPSPIIYVKTLPVPKPDLVVEDITRDQSVYKVTYCNRGQGLSSAKLAIRFQNTTNQKTFDTQATLSVPTPGQCLETGGITCALIGSNCTDDVQLTATADGTGVVPESNETNNSFSKSFAKPVPACPKKSQGDANCDNIVNLADLDIYRAEVNGEIKSFRSDFNEDKKLNITDFVIWKYGYLAEGNTQPTSTVTQSVTPTTVPTTQVSPTTGQPSATTQPSPTSIPDFAFIRAIGTAGTGNGQLRGPSGVAVFNNELYVSDTLNNRIQVFDLNGTYKRQWSTGTGSSPGEIAVVNGLVYVVQNRTIGASTGRSIATYSSTGTNQTYISSNMESVAVAGSNTQGFTGTTYYDPYDFRDYVYGITKFNGTVSAGSVRGDFQGVLSMDASANGSFVYIIDYDPYDSRPSQVKFIDTEKNLVTKSFDIVFGGSRQQNVGYGDLRVDGNYIYVTHLDEDKVYMYDMNGDQIDDIIAGGTGNGQVQSPAGITTAGDLIIVADSGNNRVQLFRKPSN